MSAEIELVDMPLVQPGGKEMPCDGCWFLRQGDQEGSKSRQCRADKGNLPEYLQCVITDTGRKIWKKKEAS